MKKIFLSFLAIIAMVGMVSAQRTWAYGLNMTQEGDNYTFVFKSTTAATAANLVFTDAAGEVAGKVALENVVAGENTKALALADIPGEGTLNWAVELTGAAIAEVSVISSSNKIYFPQGVVANVNTESDYFGSVYVANAQTGTPTGTSTKQSHGIFEYTQTLEPVNPAAAYAPSNLTVTDAAWDGYHRIAIDPTKDILAFAKWDASPFSVYGMNLANMNGEATNLTPDVNQPTSLCYDANGVMYVLSYDDPTRATAKYGIHKVVDGVSEEVFTNSDWVLKGHNQIACDGHGGFWVASYASDASSNLHHVGKNGIDLKIVGGKDTLGMPANFVRGQLAYDLKRDVLAVAGGKKVTLYNVVYNEETGAPTLTKWTETQGVGGKNVDGVAFDYSGDLLVASASVETLFKYALPTENNTCTTPAKKAQVIVKETTEEPVEPEYEVIPIAINDLVMDFDNMLLMGSYIGQFNVEVTLGLGEYDRNTDTYQLNPASSVIINNTAATFVEGTAVVDGFARTAEAVVRCLWGEMAVELQLSMSSAPLEATVVVVENAAVEVEKFIIFGDEYDYSLKMTGIWTNEGVDYPVLVEVPVYYPEATEPSEINSTVTVGDLEDENGPWFGFGEGTLTITTIGNTVTATGVVENPDAGIAIDITISGTVQQGPTGVENLNGTVAPVKVIENGQIFIIRNGVKYNAQGAKL